MKEYKMKKIIISLSVLLLFITTTSAQDLGATIAMELLKDNIIQARHDIIKANMELPKGTDSTFWVIYDEYVVSQKQTMDERTNLVTSYATAYYTMSDEQAQDLALRTFKNNKKYAKLQEKIFKKLSKKISPTVAFRFTQLINRMNTMIELQLINEIPILPAEPIK